MDDSLKVFLPEFFFKEDDKVTDDATKHFALPIYLYLMTHRGKCGFVDTSVSQLLRWCGHKKSSTSYADGHVEEVRNALTYLESVGIIGDILDCETMASVMRDDCTAQDCIDKIAFSSLISIEVNQKIDIDPSESFRMLPVDSYLEILKCKNDLGAKKFWRVLCIYCFVKLHIYDRKNSHFKTSIQKISDDCAIGYKTVLESLKILMDMGLIYYKPVTQTFCEEGCSPVSRRLGIIIVDGGADAESRCAAARRRYENAAPKSENKEKEKPKIYNPCEDPEAEGLY